jgi:hypothetical protein
VCTQSICKFFFHVISIVYLCLLIKDFALAESCYEPASTMGMEEMQGLQHCILNAFSSAG